MQDKIREILSEQERQLEIDAMIKIIESKGNISSYDAIKSAKEELISEKQEDYLDFEQKRRDENRKYTQSFREEIQKQQEKKMEEERRRKRVENAIRIYEKHKENFAINRVEQEQEYEKSRSIIDRIKEFFHGSKENKTAEESEKNKTRTHKEFQQDLRNITKLEKPVELNNGENMKYKSKQNERE